MQLKTEWDVLETGIYNGRPQIKVGYIKDDVFKPKTHKVIKKDGSESFPPVAVQFDNNEQAIMFEFGHIKELARDKYVSYLAAALSDEGIGVDIPEPEPNPISDEDEPF